MRKLRFVNSEEEKITFSEGCELSAEESAKYEFLC